MDLPVREDRAAPSLAPAVSADPAPTIDRARLRRLFVAVMAPMNCSRWLVAARAASRVPALRFAAGHPVTAPAVE